MATDMNYFGLIRTVSQTRPNKAMEIKERNG